MIMRLASSFSTVCLTLLYAVIIAVTLPAATASAQSEPLLGTWSLVWEGARDNYTGTLAVAKKVGNSVFQAKLTLIKSDGTRVTQDASLTVSGNEIRIECSNPDVKPWNPDRFYVVRAGNRMEGYSLDTAGQRGRKIVFTRR